MKSVLNFAIFVVFPGIALCQMQKNFSTPIDFKGTAYDLKKHNPVYTEEYRGGLTCYRNTEGKEIAERELDFSKSDLKPQYAFKDLRDGYEEGADVVGDRIHVFFRASQNASMKEKNLKAPEPCIIDGGFKNFLKENWDGLARGKRIRFYFIAPSQLDYFAFVAHQSDSTVTTRTFSIELDNFVLRLLVPPILVTYNSSTKMMTQYQGISNINDAKGKSLKVRLVYSEKGP